METFMKTKRSIAISAGLFTAAFFLFVLLYGAYVDDRAQKRVNNHSRVIASAMWDFETGGILEYLDLACRAYNYRAVRVVHGTGEVLIEIDHTLQSTMDRFLISLKLMPSANITSDVVYNEKVIGQIAITWYNTAIYTYAYVFFLAFLMLMVTQLFLRIVKAKQGLETRVKERTATLREEITERKQAEKALRESEERYRLLFNSTNDAVFVHQPSAEGKPRKFFEVNDIACKMYNYTREELLELTPSDLIVTEQKEDLQGLIKRMFSEGHSVFEIIHKNKEGENFPVEISAFVFDFHGTPTVLSIVRDITNRKRAEEVLKDSEERFRVLTEGSPLGIAMLGKEGKYKYINPKFISIFGYAREEIPTGREWFKRAFPDKKYRQHVISKWMNDQREFGIGESRPRHFNVTCKDGSTKVILFRPVTMENKDQFVIYEDVTEKSHLESQLQQAHKMEAIGTLAGGIAHDFNNILGIILGNTELAIDDVPDWNPARLNLKEARTACLRAKDVVRQLLGFARKTELDKRPTNIIPIIQESLKLLRSSIPTSIEIRHNITKDVSTILADPTQISQVLINLCTNAAHAMEKDGGILQINLESVSLDETTATRKELSYGRYAKLTVNDTGCGIALEDKDRIFDPYFTTKDVGKGTGMGLSVVHGIVNNHDGTILVDSEIGKGTTFNIFFPIIEKEPAPETHIDKDLPTGKERILFVDDEESLVKMGSQRLERLGYQVETTTSSIGALKLFKSRPDQFDLVITDLTMPKMTGDKLVKEILDIRPEIPIILCTGYSEKIDGEKAREMGAAGYIEKPVDNRELTMAVRRALDKN
jgi:PAS domain S-box-containing protein